ncbi:MAG: hypothetical protein JNM46_00255 [Anaerolineales bacterium]|nr:hypothetical protein [Anaerolineales bacterium]
MIRVSGHIDPNNSEYQAAIKLEQLIIEAWPSLKDSTEDHIYILVGIKCHGQRVRDVDLLLLGVFKSGITYKPFLQFINPNGEIQLPEEIVVESFCFAIEVKEHSSPNIRFTGTNVEVKYPTSKKWHNATHQNEEQKQSIINYLRLQGFRRVPWIVPLIWLRNVPSVDLPNRPHNILGSEANWLLFINVAGQLHAPQRYAGQWTLNSDLESREMLENIALMLTKEITPTNMDRRRMEQINQRLSLELGLDSLVGKQLMILRGRGGTGKTISLLQLAKHLYDERASRILVLTYNRALVADLRRLMTIMGIGDVAAEKSIQIQTSYSFFYQIMKTLGVIVAGEGEFLEKYSEHKKEILRLLSSGVITYEDIQTMLQSEAYKFDWDFIFVDEGQDWPSDERDILFKLFGYNFFTIADGIDQLIREDIPADWRGDLKKEQYRILPLRRCLRMKAGLTSCITSFAGEFGLQQSEWEPNQLVPGGRIVIFETDKLESTEELIHEIMNSAKQAGNEPIDLLVCIPSSMSQQLSISSLVNANYVPGLLQSWNIKTWDGTLSIGRDSYPTDNDQLRIVQYESCRGLEGWSTILYGLDEFYLTKLNQIRSNNSNDSEAKLLAARWLMIPLTRAMDTMVIQVSRKQSIIKDVLKKITLQHEELIDWRQA